MADVFTLIEEGDIAGQRRTGKTKKHVIYKRGEPENVFKGIYTSKHKRYQYGMARSMVFREWESPHVVLVKEIIENVKETPSDKSRGNIVIVFDNIMGHFPRSSIPNKESFSDLEYPISTDETLVKLSEVIKDRPELLTASLLEGFMHLFVLKTGDVGLQNTLYNRDTGEVFIIDYEDSRTSDYLEDPIFFFTKAPGKTYNLYEGWKGKYSEVAKRLRNFDFTLPEGVDSGIFNQSDVDKRVTLAIDLLEKYSETSEPFGSDPPGSDNIDIGQMVYVGRHANKTYHGFATSIIVSALQKNIRRGDTMQALYCAFELYSFLKLGKDASRVYHNMYNRLAVISTEDISPSPEGLVLASYVCGWATKWVQKGKLDWVSVTRLGNEENYDAPRLAAVVQMLCHVKKSRVMSHLWNAYVRPEGRQIFLDRGGELEDLSLETAPTDEDLDVLNDESASYLKPSDYNISNGDLALVVIMIYNRLVNRDRNAMAWVGYFKENFDIHVEKRSNRIKSDIVLWEVFKEFIPEPVLKPLRDAYFTLHDGRPVLQFVVSYILFRPEPVGSEGPTSLTQISTRLDDLTDQWVGRSTLGKLYYNDYTIDIKDYMVDMHTGKQGTVEELKRQFKLEGAHVENQDPDRYDPELKYVYDHTL